MPQAASKPNLYIKFEDNTDTFPEQEDGPFIWIEQIGSTIFGCRNFGLEAEEIGGQNNDGTIDAGPFEPGDNGQRVIRRYTRWTVYAGE